MDLNFVDLLGIRSQCDIWNEYQLYLTSNVIHLYVFPDHSTLYVLGQYVFLTIRNQIAYSQQYWLDCVMAIANW